MPTLPPWAQGGRIIYDTEHRLVFVRAERRGVWTAYAITGGSSPVNFTYLMRTHRVLDAARKQVLEAVGDSINTLVRACHPGADSTHWFRSYEPFKTVCGGPTYLPWNYRIDKVTCALCLAVAAEDVERQAHKVGAEGVAHARQIVVSTREANALGKIVTGEPATEHEL